jgi:hypothetical protein
VLVWETFFGESVPEFEFKTLCLLVRQALYCLSHPPSLLVLIWEVTLSTLLPDHLVREAPTCWPCTLDLRIRALGTMETLG